MVYEQSGFTIFYRRLPFVGVMWWPAKEDKTSKNPGKIHDYVFPTFWQLLFIKIQVGYSFLFTRLRVESTGPYDSHLFQDIRNNTSNTLHIKLAIGINIPAKDEQKKNKYHETFNRSVNLIGLKN